MLYIYGYRYSLLIRIVNRLTLRFISMLFDSKKASNQLDSGGSFLLTPNRNTISFSKRPSMPQRESVVHKIMLLRDTVDLGG